MPNEAQFEGITTMRTDFQPVRLSRTEDFSPKVKYEATADQRDFMSQTHMSHNPKSLVPCQVIQKQAIPKEADPNGHIYFLEG